MTQYEIRAGSMERSNNMYDVSNPQKTLTSMEVAEMIGKTHKNLLRDIRNYITQIDTTSNGFNLAPVNSK